MKAIGKIVISAIAAMSMSGAALAQEVTLRLAGFLPPSHAIVKDMVVPWAAEVERVTDGRVRIQLLDAPLGPPPLQIDLAASGAADITYGVNDYTSGRFALHGIAQLPFYADTAEAGSVAYWRIFEKHLAAAEEFKGVKVLSLFTHGPGALFVRDRAVSPVSELAGAKIRVAGPMTNGFTADLNMTPVQAPAPQSYELLSGGIIDGTYFPVEAVPFFKIDDEVTAALTVPGGAFNIAFFLAMNPRSFDRLSPEDQAAIMEVSGEAFARRAGQAWDRSDEAAMQVMRDKVEFVAASLEDVSEIERAAMPLIAEVRAAFERKGLDFDAIRKDLTAEVKAVQGQ
ncbi:TRAP transporter substrate-binding protein [Rhodobacteraceae bacterium F11138]|nr:TRAP transporter substrate-binding protein [Rhodobacteraceae bacterium F11138]